MGDKQPIVYVVDDDPVTREAVCRLATSVGLSALPFPSAAAFLESYDPDQGGCLVLDVRMPELSGLELQARLVADEVFLPVIFLTGHADVPMAVEACRAGAFDFMQKPFRPQALLETMQKAIAKDADLRRQRVARDGFRQLASHLTRRERQIMDLLLDGETTKQIAYRLDLSPKTIDYHRQHIMQKMRVSTVVKLTQLASSGR